MTTKKSAIIIGAGIGGIVTSLYLAKNGYSIDVLEKNAGPGGRCGHIIRDGHRFDLGATILLMPSVYREVLHSLGLNLEDLVELNPLPELYKLYFDDGFKLDFTTDSGRMEKQLESLEAGSFQKYRTYISKGYELFLLSLHKLLGRNFYRLSDFITFRNARLLFQLKAYMTHEKYTRKFFHHPHLNKAFTFQNIYVGQNPYDAPALFSMLPAAELTEGSMFPNGGMYSFVDKLVTLATKSGVRFHYNKPVSKIKIVADKATGIITEDGKEMSAGIIIANADLPYVYRELLPDKRISARIERSRYACSAIVFHWGLDKRYPQFGHHTVFLSDNYKHGLDHIFKEKSISDTPSFYIHAPVGTDATAAPPGEDTISVIVPAGHVDERFDQDWTGLKTKARAAIINRLKTFGMEDIEKHIKFEICYTPNIWKNIYNISKGSVFGSLSHNIMQMGYFRPHNRHARYRNVYFVGGSTHPGNGVPLVLLSSKLVSERILKEAGVGKR
jgi:phytoene desaturase